MQDCIPVVGRSERGAGGTKRGSGRPQQGPGRAHEHGAGRVEHGCQADPSTESVRTRHALEVGPSKGQEKDRDAHGSKRAKKNR